MRKQPYLIADLTGGYNPSKNALFLVDKESPNLLNVRLWQEMIRKDLSYNEFGNGLPLDGVPMFSDTFYTYDGSEHMLVVTDKWIYRYNGSSETYQIKNPTDFDSGSIALTFAESGSTITRGSGNFTTDGFQIGDTITTGSTNNPGHFTISNVTALVITVNETIADESATTTVYHLVELAGGETNPFSCCSTIASDGTDVYFLTNGIDEVMRWEGGSGGDDLFEFVTDFYAKVLGVFKGRLIYGWQTDGGYACPKRVGWSVLDDPDDLTGTGSGFVELDQTVDWVVAFAPLKNKFYVVKERSIWELMYVGGTTYFWPEIRVDGVGTYSPLSVIPLGEDFIFLGNDNVYSYNGLSLDTLGDQMLSLFYNTDTKIVNSVELEQAVAVYIEELEEYWLAVPTKGQRSSELFKYNLRHKFWSRKEVEVSMLGYYSLSETTLWNDLVGTWDDQDWIWMEKALPAGAPTTLLGSPAGYIYEDNRLTTDTTLMRYETKDFKFAQAARWCEFHVNAKGGTFRVYYSTDSGETWSAATTLTVNSDEYETAVMYLNTTSDTVRFRIESNEGDLIIKWIEPWYIPRVKPVELVTAS